jgi:hypothetical protein
MAGLQPQQHREFQQALLECNTLAMNSVTALMTSHNIVNPNKHSSSAAPLTMNSATALMTSHNIVNPNKHFFREEKFCLEQAPYHRWKEIEQWSTIPSFAFWLEPPQTFSAICLQHCHNIYDEQ